MTAHFCTAPVFSDTCEVEDKDVFNGAWLLVSGPLQGGGLVCGASAVPPGESVLVIVLDGLS